MFTLRGRGGWGKRSCRGRNLSPHPPTPISLPSPCFLLQIPNTTLCIDWTQPETVVPALRPCLIHFSLKEESASSQSWESGGQGLRAGFFRSPLKSETYEPILLRGRWYGLPRRQLSRQGVWELGIKTVRWTGWVVLDKLHLIPEPHFPYFKQGQCWN